MSSQLPFNTEAMLTLAPSEYGVGFKVYMMADRMYPCDPAKTQKINKVALNFVARVFRPLSDALEEIGYLSRGYLYGYQAKICLLFKSAVCCTSFN